MVSGASRYHHATLLLLAYSIAVGMALMPMERQKKDKIHHSSKGFVLMAQSPMCASDRVNWRSNLVILQMGVQRVDYLPHWNSNTKCPGKACGRCIAWNSIYSKIGALGGCASNPDNPQRDFVCTNIMCAIALGFNTADLSLWQNQSPTWISSINRHLGLQAMGVP